MNHLNERMEGYRLLSRLFLTLPDTAFAESLKALRIEGGENEGLAAIGAFIENNKNRPPADIARELGVDRAKLLRGLSETGIRPPYESLYTGREPQEVLGSLARFYAGAGCVLAESLRESGEQLGAELAFMALLYERELAAEEGGDRREAAETAALRAEFLDAHPGRWAEAYAGEMEAHAETGFYRGIALLLRELIRSEAVRL